MVRKIIITALAFFITWLIFSFLVMEYNATKWDINWRVIYVITSGTLSVILLNEKEKKQ